jgi:NADH-quinone oxidoreductase subunit E
MGGASKSDKSRIWRENARGRCSTYLSVSRGSSTQAVPAVGDGLAAAWKWDLRRKCMEEETLDLTPLYELVQPYKTQPGALIPVLQKAQEIYGWLPEEVLQAIAAEMKVPPSRIYGVVTFYSQFYLTRRGRHIVRQCDGTACHVKGAARIVDAVESHLGIKAGETTPDYRVTFEVVYCLGSCGLAPVAMIDDKVVGHLVPETLLKIIDSLE